MDGRLPSGILSGLVFVLLLSTSCSQPKTNVVFEKTPTKTASATPPAQETATPTNIPQVTASAIPQNQPALTFNSWEIVHDLAFSPDGRLLAVSTGDQVHLYDAATMQEKAVIAPGAWASRLAFHPTLPLIALAVQVGSVQFWDIASGAQVCQFTAHVKGAKSLSIHPDGRLLATTGTDITSRLWDISSLSDGNCDVSETGKLIGRSYSSPDISFSPDGKSIALVDLTDIRLRNSSDRKLIALLKGELPIYDIAFSADGRWLAAAENQGTVALWDLSQPSDPNLSSLFADEINPKAHFWRVAFSSDSSLLAAGDSDGVVTLWDMANFLPIMSQRLSRAVTALAFSPDGNHMAVGGLDSAIWLFPVP